MRACTRGQLARGGSAPAEHFALAAAQVIGIRREASELKETEQVRVLPVYVTHDLQWCLNLEHYWLLLNNCLGFRYEAKRLLIGDLHDAARPRALDRDQALNY